MSRPSLFNRETLQARLAAGERLKFVFFWSHDPLPSGRIGNPCLSQWWPASFSVDGVSYATAEHFMMAEKARLFGDAAALDRILQAPHPGAAKATGREVRGFDSEVWEAQRTAIVVRGNQAKFAQDPALTAYLLNTGQRVLVEASPVDTIWGIGLAADDPQASDPHRWQGLNLLGFALMEVRRLLREAAEA